jgi:hypothetical protein
MNADQDDAEKIRAASSGRLLSRTTAAMPGESSATSTQFVPPPSL